MLSLQTAEAPVSPSAKLRLVPERPGKTLDLPNSSKYVILCQVLIVSTTNRERFLSAAVIGTTIDNQPGKSECRTVRVALVTNPRCLSVTVTAIFLNFLASPPTPTKSKRGHPSQLKPIKDPTLTEIFL